LGGWRCITLYQNLCMPFRRFSAAGLRALLQGTSVLALCLGLALAPAPAVTFEPSHLVAYARQHYGPQAGRAVQAWQDMLREAAGKSEQEKLRMVNQFWDQALIGGEDITIWGPVDYWATARETVKTM
jgi:predicted transglutaminase-like cysteine proteinase